MNYFTSPDNSGRKVTGEIIQGAPSENPVSASIELIQNEESKIDSLEISFNAF